MSKMMLQIRETDPFKPMQVAFYCIELIWWVWWEFMHESQVKQKFKI